MISIDRSGMAGDLDPLLIPAHPGTGRWHLDESGITWPAFDTRRLYAPDSHYASGRSLLAAVRGAGELPVTIYAHGTSGADLEASKGELEAALAQWSYSLTLTVDSVAHVYDAEIVLGIPWGPIDSGMVSARLARTSFSIPVNP